MMEGPTRFLLFHPSTNVMMMNDTGPFVWANDEVEVNVPYSGAGVGTTIILASKFTGKIMLLDVGDGTLRDLLGQGRIQFVHDLDLVAITHGHFDHMGGIHSLLGFLRMMERSEKLHILLPADCIEAIEAISGFRNAYKDTLSFSFWYHELTHGTGFDTDFFKVSALQVEHFGMENATDKDTLMPALGYRVRVGDTVIAYTGDTRMCTGAEDVVRDADLAIIEATRKETPESKRRVHLSEEEARNLGKLAKEFILIHRIPSIED
ncbi:MAG: MBL fold metallo-hydrolase [Candidatus Thorarchaeota archaeon]|jgi:ribonuclease Z